MPLPTSDMKITHTLSKLKTRQLQNLWKRWYSVPIRHVSNCRPLSLLTSVSKIVPLWEIGRSAQRLLYGFYTATTRLRYGHFTATHTTTTRPRYGLCSFRLATNGLLTVTDTSKLVTRRLSTDHKPASDHLLWPYQGHR